MTNAYMWWQAWLGGSENPKTRLHNTWMFTWGHKVIMLNSWKTRRTKYLLGCSGSENDIFFSKNCRLLCFSREGFSERHSKSKVGNLFSNYQTNKVFCPSCFVRVLDINKFDLAQNFLCFQHHKMKLTVKKMCTLIYYAIDLTKHFAK